LRARHCQYSHQLESFPDAEGITTSGRSSIRPPFPLESFPDAEGITTDGLGEEAEEGGSKASLMQKGLRPAPLRRCSAARALESFPDAEGITTHVPLAFRQRQRSKASLTQKGLRRGDCGKSRRRCRFESFPDAEGIKANWQTVAPIRPKVQQERLAARLMSR